MPLRSDLHAAHARIEQLERELERAEEARERAETTLADERKKTRGLPGPAVASREVDTKGKASRIGRNSPCPCGSGEKYKRCCLDRALEPVVVRGPSRRRRRLLVGSIAVAVGTAGLLLASVWTGVGAAVGCVVVATLLDPPRKHRELRPSDATAHWR